MKLFKTIGADVLLLTLLACSQQKAWLVLAASEPAAAPAGSGSASRSGLRTIPTIGDRLRAFNEIRAMRYVKEIVAFGPRPIGSANHKKVEDYIHAHLKGDVVEDDAFTIDTTEGKFPVHNIIAKYPGTRDGIIVIASHYDTNYPLRDTAYVGANDGASSSALLLGNCEPVARQEAATATACGCCGMMRKSPCGCRGSIPRPLRRAPPGAEMAG